jgi:polyphosphate kinase
MREKILVLINREIENVKNSGIGRIVFKLNSLVDPVIISSLYEASNNGVKIDLIIRGICCLVPGVEGLSENIRVTSIVGRFLEHSRILLFYNNGNEEVYLGSADMMQRNLDRRVEIIFPLQDEKLKNSVIKTVLKIYLKDNVKARRLLPDMTYQIMHPQDGDKKIDSQEWLMNHTIKVGGSYTKIKI